MHALVEGIVLGFTLALILGPAFFSLIQTSIHRGLKSGLLLALGVFLSDTVILVLCYLGASQVIYEGRNALIFGIIGGIMLIIFGVFTFRRKVVLANGVISTRTPSGAMFVLKGFFLNFANPFIWFFWMGVVVLVTSNYVGKTRQIYSFFTGVLLTIVTTDFIKCFISNKIKSYLNAFVLTTMNRLVGLTLAIFGVVLIVRVILQFTALL